MDLGENELIDGGNAGARRRHGARAASALLGVLAVLVAAPAAFAVPPGQPVPMGSALWWSCIEPAATAEGMPVCNRQPSPEYEQTFSRNFQWFTPENEFKMVYLQPEQDRWNDAILHRILGWAQRHGKKVRGHALIWGMQNPEWLTRQPLLGERRRSDWLAIMKDHIQHVMRFAKAYYPGVVSEWDVVNEAFDDNGRLIRNPWSAGIGPDYIEHAFRYAREADPEARLFFNETGAEHPGAKQDAVARMIAEFRRRNVPIHGVGVQMHVATGGRAPALSDMRGMFTRFRELHADVAITEMDVPLTGALPGLDPITEQERIYSDASQACREASNCTSLTVWGVADPYSWKGGGFKPLLFDDVFGAKAAARVATRILRKPLKALKMPVQAPNVVVHMRLTRLFEKGCRGVKARVGGADFAKLAQVEYYLGKRLVSRVGAAPFQSRIRGRTVSRYRARHLKVRVVLQDGRVGLVRRPLGACGGASRAKR